MSAIRFLFWRKLVYVARFWLLITGYDIKRRELSERLYGVYVLIILLGWALVMLSFGVVALTDQLARLGPSPADLEPLLFFLFAAWLAATPWLAGRSYDLYRFSLPDLDFLSSAPIPVQTVTTWWFGKSLFTVGSGVFVLACATLASALMRIRQESDLLGLAFGTGAGVGLLVVARGFLWMLGLLRYHPRPRLTPAFGALLSGMGFLLLVLLFISPVEVLRWPLRAIYWPAWLASLLVSGDTGLPVVQSLSLYGWALLVLTLTAGLAVAGLRLVARGSLLAPAFEEGRLGGQLRRAAGSGGLTSDARVQIYLARRVAAGRSLPGISSAEGAGRKTKGGPIGALLRKEWLRLRRLPPAQMAARVLAPVLLGLVVAAGLMLLVRFAPRIEVLAPATFFATFALLRTGVLVVRNDLAHLDFVANLPVSRGRLLLTDLLMGFSPVFLAGEVALLVLAASGVNGVGLLDLSGLSAESAVQPWSLWPWLLFWPLLLGLTVLVALVEMQRLMRKWPATPETIPEIGPGVIFLTGLAWLLLTLWAQPWLAGVLG